MCNCMRKQLVDQIRKFLMKRFGRPPTKSRRCKQMFPLGCRDLRFRVCIYNDHSSMLLIGFNSQRFQIGFWEKTGPTCCKVLQYVIGNTKLVAQALLFINSHTLKNMTGFFHYMYRESAYQIIQLAKKFKIIVPIKSELSTDTNILFRGKNKSTIKKYPKKNMQELRYYQSWRLVMKHHKINTLLQNISSLQQSIKF